MSINFSFKNNINPKQGLLLIANPAMVDPTFHKAVILICEYNENGTLGLIINKPTNISLSESVKELDQLDTNMYHGGPVDLSGLYMIHRNSNIKNSKYIANDLYYNGNLQDISPLHNTNRMSINDIRFFRGYSTWYPLQLENELQRNNWIIFDEVNSDFIFNTSPEQMWNTIISTLGNDYKIFMNYPLDPSLN